MWAQEFKTMHLLLKRLRNPALYYCSKTGFKGRSLKLNSLLKGTITIQQYFDLSNSRVWLILDQVFRNTICWRPMKLPSHHLFILLKSAIITYCVILVASIKYSAVLGENILIDNFSFIYKPCLHNLKNNVYFFFSSPFLQQVNIVFKMSL